MKLIDKLLSSKSAFKISRKGQELTIIPEGFALLNKEIVPVYKIYDTSGDGAREIEINLQELNDEDWFEK